MLARLPERGSDPMGDGSFGAPRGTRTHRGIDYACYPGTHILALHAGQVTKLGYPYGDDLSYRYVQVSENGRAHRYFYVKPAVAMGERVNKGDLLGFAQNINARKNYGERGMKNHVHYEVRVNNEFVDPTSIS